MAETSEIAEALNHACRPAIWLCRVDAAPGKSRLGGLPSLPIEVEWPREQETGFPLHFLAQIDLSELPITPLEAGGPALPRSGMLMFFAAMDEEMTWSEAPHSKTRVIYSELVAPDRAAPRDLPPFLFDCYGDQEDWTGETVFPETPLKAYIINSFGQQLYGDGEMKSAAERRMLASIERATGNTAPKISSDRRSSATQPPFAITIGQVRRVRKSTWTQRVLKRLGLYSGKSNDLVDIVETREISIRQHLMFGAATSVQGTGAEMQESGSILLLQIDTDWGVSEDFQFCDMGMAQFWMLPEDLKARRFQQAWATTEGA